MWSIFFLINDLLLKGSIFCWGTYVFGLNLPSILKKCLINVGNGFHLRAVYLEGNQFWYKPHCPHTCSNTLLKSLMVIRKLKVLWINDGTIKNVRSPSLQKTIYKCVHICFYTDSFIDWLTFFLLLHSCQSDDLITICRERKKHFVFCVVDISHIFLRFLVCTVLKSSKTVSRCVFLCWFRCFPQVAANWVLEKAFLVSAV